MRSAPTLTNRRPKPQLPRLLRLPLSRSVEDLEQYGVELEIMKNGERKLIAAFGICLSDIESQHFQKTKLRKIDSQMKSLQAIEIKYKVFEGKPLTPVENKNVIHVTEIDNNQAVHQLEDITDGAILNIHDNNTKNEVPLNVTMLQKISEKCRPN